MGSVLVAAALAGPVAAAPGKVKKPEPQVVSNIQLVESLHVLITVKVVMEQANHDYGGHRADAVKCVKGAIHHVNRALEHEHKHHKNTLPKDFKPGKWSPEPQAISNFQLIESIKILEKTAAFLRQANHDYGGHRANAIHDIELAIHQLQVALKFEKKHAKDAE
jgi:hypothetical protein